jgi:hypothetical protein
MGLAVEERAFVSAVAAEIDRVVVRGHERAADFHDMPPAVTQMTAFPQLLSSAAIVLLDRPMTRADVARIIPYTPSALVDGLVDNNIAEGVVSERDGPVELTDRGRAAAEGIVFVQEAAFAELWSAAAHEVKTVGSLLTRAVDRARTVEAPRTPSNFTLFAAHCDRPTEDGKVLRLITSVRYWRSDAHARAIAEADLRPFEAHALNRLWDAHRGVNRIGQGFDRPGQKGVASLEARRLAESGAITREGVELREEIERETDRLTAPIYDSLDESSRDQLLTAISALPS